MIRTIASHQNSVSLIAQKAARWEARAWGHYLDYLSLMDVLPEPRAPADAARLSAAHDACEYCCRRLQTLAAPFLDDKRMPYEPPLTPGTHELPVGYVYNPPQITSNLSGIDIGPRLAPPRDFDGSSASRRGFSSYLVLTGLSGMVALGIYRILAGLLHRA